MTRLVKEKLSTRKGAPLFGTVVLDADLVIFLQINDETLRARCVLREASFTDAKNMREQLKRDIAKSGIERLDYQLC